MNSLTRIIKVDDTNMTISARDLHDALEIETRFNVWFPRMTEYGFTEGSDYRRVSQICDTPGGKQEVTDYQISIDMAKEICMIQRTEKGREVRKYFLDLEKAWNTPEQIMARALRMADKTIASLQDQVRQISAENEVMKPKALFADAVATADTSILIGDLAKLIRQNGYDIGQNRLFGWLRDNGYLVKHGDAYNMPTQKSMDLGLFEVKERTIGNPDGSTRITRTTKVTGKGQQYFINKFLGGAKCSAT